MTSPEHDSSSTTSPSLVPGELSVMAAEPPSSTPVPFPRPAPPGAVDRGRPPELIVTTLTSNQVVVLVVAGDVDRATAPILHRALESAAVVSPGLVVVDLSAVKFFACAGLSSLVAAQHRAGDRDRLRVVASRRAVRRPLELTGLDEWLTVCRNRAEALTPLRGSR